MPQGEEESIPLLLATARPCRDRSGHRSVAGSLRLARA